MKRLLVPLDGSSRSEAVLPAAWHLSRAFGAEILLFHAVERAAPETVHGERHLRSAREASDYLSSVAARAPEGLAVASHVHEEAAADAASAIAEHVEELDADLILIATHGVSRFGRFLRGSVAQRALFRGGAPVLTLPDGCCADLACCQSLVVAVEGSGGHGVPFAEASLFARALGASIELVLAVDRKSTLKAGAASFARARPGASRAVLAATVLAAEEYLKAAAASAEFAGLSVETAILRGAPEKALSAYAKGRGDVLFVLQTHGKSGIGAFWEGSVAARIVARLDCPALLVPTTGDVGSGTA